MSDPGGRRTTVWELLAEPDYKRLLGAQYIGQAADGLAQGVMATELVLDPLTQGTPGRILGLFVLTLLPYSLLSPFLGVFVDRWDRKRLLVGTNLARAILLFTLPIWVDAFADDTGLMIGILGVLGFGRLFHTTKAAVLPVVLHEHHLVRGNTLSSVGGTLSVLAGGIAGLWLGGVVDIRVALIGVGAIYLIAAAGARRIQTDLAHRHDGSGSLSAELRRVALELVDGLRQIGRRRLAATSLASIFAMRTITILVAIGVILVIKGEFTGERSSAGLALGAVGVGAFLASLSAPKLSDRYVKPRLIAAGFVVAGVGIVALGGITALPAVLALMTILGFGGFVTKVAADSQIQEALPDEYRGRAFALYDILYNLASIAAGVIVVLFEAQDVRPLLLFSGLATILIGYTLAASMRSAPAMRPS